MQVDVDEWIKSLSVLTKDTGKQDKRNAFELLLNSSESDLRAINFGQRRASALHRRISAGEIRNWEDLQKTPGIGPMTYSKIIEHFHHLSVRFGR